METRNKRQGFTLIELMITIALVAILLSFAGPGFVELIRRNQVRSITDDFYTAYNTARSEAVKRNQQVTVCASSDGASCDADNWDSGWLMFIDENSNGAVNGGEDVVHKGEALPGGYTLRADAPYSSSITMNPDGSVNGINGSFRVCSDEQAADKGRTIRFFSVGRPRLQKGADECP